MDQQPPAAIDTTTPASPAAMDPESGATGALPVAPGMAGGESPLHGTIGTLTIADRYQLLYLLDEAAELEHGACCTYLFAAWSLKTTPAEGLTAEQTATIGEWKKTIAHIAVQEMMHLALVTNLLTALGGTPHFDRPNFPQRSLYAPELQLALTPFNERTLERFLYFERPEGMDIAQLARDFDVSGPRIPAVAAMTGPLIVPAPQDFSSIGQLYRGIEQGLRRLVGASGEAGVFVGSPRAQATAHFFQAPERMPELIPVTDLASALQAIETIVEEGEGARGAWQEAHFGRFVSILQTYRAFREQDPAFAPARPVLENPYAHVPPGVAGHADVAQVNLIDDPRTSAAMDLFNGCYAAMLQVLHRFFMHSEESDAELATLSGASMRLMLGVVQPLGELLTTLPAGPRYAGMTAGPNFQASRRIHVTTHKAAAWAILRERLLELAAACDRLAAQLDMPHQLHTARHCLEGVAARLAPTASG